MAAIRWRAPAALLAVLVGACGGTGSESGSSGAAGGAAGEQRPICIVAMLVGTPYADAAKRGAEEAARQLGVDLEYGGPTERGAASQVELIDELRRMQRCSAIAVAAHDPEALAPAMRRAKEAGIATSTWDADSGEDGRDVFVRPATSAALARALVDAMAQQTDEKGDLVVVADPSTAPDQAALLAEMRAHTRSKYLDMTIVEVLEGGEEAEALDVTRRHLRANPDTAGVFALGSAALAGVAPAVERSRRGRRPAVIGLGPPSEMEEYVKAGTVSELVSWSPADLGYLAVHVAAAQVRGKNPTGARTFDAGRLGDVAVLAKDEILLGRPLRFTRRNIDP